MIWNTGKSEFPKVESKKFFQTSDRRETKVSALLFDPTEIDLFSFLSRPIHDFTASSNEILIANILEPKSSENRFNKSGTMLFFLLLVQRTAVKKSVTESEVIFSPCQLFVEFAFQQFSILTLRSDSPRQMLKHLFY